MTVFTGKSVYDAAVCGLICILRKPKLSAERMHVDDISTELKRVEAARIVAAEQLQQLYELFLDKIGDTVRAGSDADIKPGNALALADIPVGTVIHNIEMHPGKGAQMVRSAGNMAQLMAKENGMALIRLPSGELRNVAVNCMASIGTVSNLDHENVNLGKAGRTRHLGVRPTVRGSVMNPNDHPHGGGEGKSPVGRPGPVTPWGKPALGYKTRSTKKSSNKFIVKRRNSK